MALFHCDSCGYEQSVSPQCIDRTARCPECLHLSIVQPDPVAANPVPIPTPIRYRFWWLAALCGIILVLQVFAFHEALMSGEKSPAVTSTQRRTDAVPAVAPIADQKTESQQIATVDRHRSTVGSTPPSKDHGVANRDNQTPEPVVIGSSSSAHHADRQPAAPKSETDQPGQAPTISPDSVESPPVAESASVKEREVTPEQLAEGKELFEHEWKVHDKLSAKGDGLGPVYNARSCVECHFQSGIGGSGTNSHSVQAFEILPDRDGGEIREGVIHTFATNARNAETRSQLFARMGSPKVPFVQNNTNKTVTSDAIRTVFINTPALWGNGLIDQITDRDLIQLEQTHRLTGRFRRLPDGQIGKFGWKSQIATLHQFVGSACAAEIGLSNSVRPQQIPQVYEDNVDAKHDLTDGQVTSLVNFVASLPAPKQVLPTDAKVLAAIHEGNKLFSSVGCANCHVPDVGAARGVFSDFRLHLVASSSVSTQSYYPVDSTPVYKPSGAYAKLGEWKTPPLWGVADTAPYWHDGSALTLRDAILKHTEEGKDVATKFTHLGQDQQQQLLTFLGSLKAPDVIR